MMTPAQEYEDAMETLEEWNQALQRFVDADALNFKRHRKYWEGQGCQHCFWDFNTEMAGLPWIEIHWDIDPEKGDTLTIKPPNIIKKYKAALKAWNDPRTRRPDRFYCKRHTEWLQAGIALYPNTLGGLAGHVAWAYTIPTAMDKYYKAIKDTTGRWLVGSFGAALKSLSTSPGSSTQNLQDQVVDPISDFVTQGYAEWKALMSGDGNYEEAYLIAKEITKEPYLLLSNNCMDVTDRLLRGFGVEALPWLLPSFTPKKYFNNINQPSVSLKDAPTAPEITGENVPRVRKEGSAVTMRQFLSPVLDALSEQIASLEKMRPGKTSTTTEAPFDKPDKFVTMMVKALDNFRGRDGSVKIDGKNLLKNSDTVSTTLQRVSSNSDKDLLRQIKQKVSEAIKESDWRKNLNKNPLQSEKMPIHPDLSINTEKGWADLDYHSCKDKKCCKN